MNECFMWFLKCILIENGRDLTLIRTCMSVQGSVVLAQGAGILLPGHMTETPWADGW